MTSICKVWKPGTKILAITIPMNERIIHDIKDQDYVQVTFQKMEKKQTTEEKNNE